MLGLSAAPRTILCLGAHSDDIEIGCGASLMGLIDALPGVSVHWLVFSGNERRAAETRLAAERMLTNAGDRNVMIESFRDGYFPWDGAAIKDRFEALKRDVEPDIVFTHYRDDRHQDHRTISDLTWNTFRDHMVLEYEIPKYDGDLGVPNCYMPVTEAHRKAKVETLIDCFPSQSDHAWFTADTFNGLMRLRGMECAAPEGFAEAFHARKWIFARLNS